MKSRIIAAALGTSIAPLLAGPVFADGPSEPTVEPQPVTQAAPAVTQNPWAGPYVGAQIGWGAVDADGPDDDGVIGGVHAGYLASTGPWVFGAEADYDFADIDIDDSSGEFGDVDGIGRLKAKGGYSFGRTLVYATAGAANLQADVNGGSENDWGWTAGAGLDYLITDRVSVGGEILYHEFDDFDGTGADVESTTATVRVSYRF